MTIAVVAEKPAVARDIARVLGARQRGDGLLAGNGYTITWALGHLVGLAQPHEIDRAWRRWQRDTLPMLPGSWPLVVSQETRHQFEVVRSVLNDGAVERVICATDAGREGELIFRYIYEAAGCTKPWSRLWISSLTSGAIRRGFEALRDGRAYDPLADAARGRSRADWLVGMNLSRACTLAYAEDKGDTLSVGRVQTPTLAMVVEREKAIRAFVPEDYREVVATFRPATTDAEPPASAPTASPDSNADTYEGTWFRPPKANAASRRLPAEGEEAEAIVARARRGKAAIDTLRAETRRLLPPFLYDLTELQRHANRLYGFSARKTLAVAQNLYEQKKLITYPRTDSRHLSTEVAAGIGEVVAAIRAPYERLLAPETGIRPLSQRFVDDAKVTDHHAIIPTATTAEGLALGRDDQKIYDLVCRRLLSAWHEPHVTSVTTVITTITTSEEGADPLIDRFHSTGTQVLKQGWKVLDLEVKGGKGKGGKKRGKKASDPGPALPAVLRQGQAQTVEKAAAVSKTTKPPKRFTEATLLTAMETAGKTLDDRKLSAAMRECGLGTPATRAEIIETLLRRAYVTRQGKVLAATDKGIRLIEVVHPQVKSPAMTGQWEAQLNRIQRGEGDLASFMAGIEAYVREVVGETFAQERKTAGARSTAPTPVASENSVGAGRARPQGSLPFAAEGKPAPPLRSPAGPPDSGPPPDFGPPPDWGPPPDEPPPDWGAARHWQPASEWGPPVRAAGQPPRGPQGPVQISPSPLFAEATSLAPPQAPTPSVAARRGAPSAATPANGGALQRQALPPAPTREPTPPDGLADLLREVFGFSHFRPYQEAVCREVTQGSDVLLVMPTGAGKSLCYQLPGLARAGTTLVVSPLIALMEDQVAKLQAQGLRAERIHSGRGRSISRRVSVDYLAGRLDFLFIAPERLSVPGFPEMLAKRRPVLVAIDEAHCISHWGHDFRPDYRLLGDRLPQLRPAPIIALTATATPLVQNDITAQLGIPHAEHFIHGFRRTNIAVEVVEMRPSERREAVGAVLADPARRPAIVYAPTRKEAEALGEMLAADMPAAAYHAGMMGDSRDRVQAAFLRGQLEVIVATIAFGMGVDKPDVRTVIHTGLPGSLEGYYQEIGRAGRDGAPSRAILLYSYADRRTHEFFHGRDYPEVIDLERIYAALGEHWQSKDRLFGRLRMDDETFDKALEKLWIHGGARIDPDENVARGETGWQQRYIAQRDHKLAQLEQIMRFAQAHGCRMLHLVQHFGDQEDSGAACEICDVCAPEHCNVRRFRKPSSEERVVIRRILEVLRGRDSFGTGQLYKQASIGDLERRTFERMLGGLARAGLVEVREESFQKEGRTIHYQRAGLSAKGYSGGPKVGDDIELAVPPAKKARTRTKKASKKSKSSRKSKQAAVALEDLESGASGDLVEALRVWRLGEARRRKIPAFRILPNRTLAALAVHQPRDEASLLAVPGIGPTLARKYGTAILELIKKES